MSHEIITLYKLMILYMLDNLDVPLTTSQLSTFFVSQEYATYFSLQQSIHELCDASFIKGTVRRNTTSYNLTREGKEALDLFIHKLPQPIRSDILDYLEKSKYELRKETELAADYTRTKNGDYMATLTIHEKQSTLLALSVNLISEKQAIEVCDRWPNKSEEIYDHIIKSLLLGKETEGDGENSP